MKYKTSFENRIEILSKYANKLISHFTHFECVDRKDYHQELLMKAYEASLTHNPNHKGAAELESWCFGSMKQHMMNIRKTYATKHKGVSFCSIDDMGGSYEIETDYLITNIYKKCKPQQRMVLKYKLMGYTHKEISSKMEVSVGRIGKIIEEIKQC